MAAKSRSNAPAAPGARPPVRPATAPRAAFATAHEPPPRYAEPALDFGFRPTDSEHHFLLMAQPRTKEMVFFELFAHDPNLSADALRHRTTEPGCKCILPRVKWDLIADAVRQEFNRRGAELQARPATFRTGPGELTYVHRLLGKELLVLVWAIEDADPGVIPLAVQNWLGLRPEERWWLYTITNAATGQALAHRRIGWRQALRWALTDNPSTAGRIDYNAYNDRTNTPSMFAREIDPDAAKLQ